jgi:Baculovirus major capsid protein VP39
VGNLCIFGAVQPFDACRTYSSPCSPDANVKDDWFICEYHASIRFKIEKMVLPISDGEGNTLYRTVGKSLVSDTAEGNERILIPTRNNYESVLKLNALSLPEQLVFHMIYDNRDKQERVCDMLRYNESIQTDIYEIVENVYNRTATVLALTDPGRYCSRVSNNSTRVYGGNDRDAIAMDVINQMPGFLKNLINQCVAPQDLMLEGKNLQLRESPTCSIDNTGLVANVPLYNPVRPRYRSGYNKDLLHIEQTLRITGSDAALNKLLARYEPYPVVVPLILGTETMLTANSERPVPQRAPLPPRDNLLPPLNNPDNADVLMREAYVREPAVE